MQKPTPTTGLSVIVPAFDEEEGVQQVLLELSATLATLPMEHEILVVDDGSTDRTQAIAESCDVHVRRHEENRGSGAALKTGLRAASDPFVAIVDDDARRILILGNRPQPIRFRRQPSFEEETIELEDHLIPERAFALDAMSLGGEFSVRYVPPSPYFQSQGLETRPLDLGTEHLNALAEGRAATVRQRLDAENGSSELEIVIGERS